MKKDISIRYQIYLAILVGISSTYLWNKINIIKLPYHINITFEDFFIIYTSLAIFFLSQRSYVYKWWWALFLIINSYFSGFYFIADCCWGQIPPIDLLFMFFGILPSIGVAYLLEIIKIKSGMLKKKIITEYVGFFITIFFLFFVSYFILGQRYFFVAIGTMIALSQFYIIFSFFLQRENRNEVDSSIK